jgi:hypothetical protein
MNNDVAALSPTRQVDEYALAPLTPSARFLYSNMGPELVARAIAAVTRTPIEAYARATLLAPLAMDGTYASAKAAPPQLLARSYTRTLKPYADTFETDPVSGAGYLTSARDLARFAIFHQNDRVGHGSSPLTLEQLRTLHEPAQGDFYNFGWGKIGSGKSEILVSDGQVDGGQAVILLVPEKRLGVVAMANAASDSVNEIAVAAMDEMDPGAAVSFRRGSESLESRRARELKPYYPPLPPWSASGTLRIQGKMVHLDAVTTGKKVVLRLAGKPFGSGTALPDDDGFAIWKLPCVKILPACVDSTQADASLSLTRGDSGYDGMIAANSTLGLFPYEVHLKSIAPTK